MAEQFPRSTNSGRPPRRIRWRLLAILIMVAGAVGFSLTLFLFNEDLFCLSSSTLLTLAGLALLITARRRGWVTAEPEPQQSTAERSAWRAPRFGGGVPRGLRNYQPSQRPSQAPFVEDHAADVVDSPAAPAGPVEVLLARQVQAILEGQGARVRVELRRADRSILRITTPSGQEHTALVLENPRQAEAAEGRALLALLQQPGSGQDGAHSTGLGYLIAAGGFSPSAYQWAADRGKIRLVGADELDELGI